MKKVLITGISGFIGKHLAKNLQKNYKLYGLGSKKSNFNGISIFNSTEIEKIHIDFEIIILCHAAVESGDLTISNDILFNVNVSLTEKIVKKFQNSFLIYLSTVSIYDTNVKVIKENSNINPQSIYALSKLWGENIILKNKKSTILRLSSVFGIDMKENTLIPNYVNQVLNNGSINIWGLGDRIQNYIHVDEVIGFINNILLNQEYLYGKILLGVSKKHFSNLEIAQIILKNIPGKINFTKEDLSISFNYNNDFTCNLINWEPKLNFEEEIINYIEWKKKF
jgi:nucleoside-diphosphate-sugar epimerase